MALKEKKTNKKNEQKSRGNKNYTTSINNRVKKIRVSLERTSDLSNLKKEFIELQSKLDKAVIKGIIHLNKANRYKQKLSKRIRDKEISLAN